MGITGLIPFLEKASTPIHIRQYKGQTVAIDAYCWLHRGIFSCAEKIARGEKCDAYINYCLKYVNMLISHEIKPILVFDGRYLPAKAATEKKRRQAREQNRARAAELLRQGRTAEARRCMRSSVDVGPEMAVEVARACRSVGADCIFAPFEADAQLAYLNKKGMATAVVTEDSDLILFGCIRVIFKLDLTGCGLEVVQDRLHLSMGVGPERFSMDRFRQMCILSGCDYLASLPGIGLAKAKKFVNSTSSPEISQALGKLPSAMGMYNLDVTEEYIKDFAKADATFLYQLVFDPIKKSAVQLNDPDEISLHSELAEKIKGDPLPPETEYQLALGNLNPFSMKPVDDFNPSGPRGPCGGGIGKNGPPKRKWKSIWDRDFVPWGKSKNFHSQDALTKVERDSTFGKEASMGVGFFQSQSVTKSPVRRSPRKRKAVVDSDEESSVKDVTCSDKDLGIIYGSPPVKKCRRVSQFSTQKEKTLDTENEDGAMVVTEILGEDENATGKLKRKLFRESKASGPRKKCDSAKISMEVMNIIDSSLEDVQNRDLDDVRNESSEKKSIERIVLVPKNNICKVENLDSAPLISTPDNSESIKCEETSAETDSGIGLESPTSPILGKRRNFNPFAKPMSGKSSSSPIKGSFLKSPSLFSQVNGTDKTPGVKMIVKSRYFVSSPPTKTGGITKGEENEDKHPRSKMNAAVQLSVGAKCEDKAISGIDPVDNEMSGVVESYSKPTVEFFLPSPFKKCETVTLVSPRKHKNPFAVESDSEKDSPVHTDKVSTVVIECNGSGDTPEAEDKSFGDDAKFSGPRKGLFNWGSLKDKFAFTPSSDVSEILDSSTNAIEQVSPQEKGRRHSLASPSTPASARGRGRGQNCRRPGLGRSSAQKTKPGISKGSDSQQSLLSRFGFQKK